MPISIDHTDNSSTPFSLQLPFLAFVSSLRSVLSSSSGVLLKCLNFTERFSHFRVLSLTIPSVSTVEIRIAGPTRRDICQKPIPQLVYRWR